MSLTLSDVNKKVCFKNQALYGPYEGRLLALSADHKIAFVEWDSRLRRDREPIDAHLLKVIEAPDERGTEVVGGGLWE